MKELLRSNDPVLASFVGSLLRDADIEFFRFDENMSVTEGSIGVLPQRFMVSAEDYPRARRILLDADIEPVGETS